MNLERKLGLALTVAMAAASLGCAADEGVGGPNGETELSKPKIRFAHLAPDLPAADDTALDFLIEDEGSFTDVAFGSVTPYVNVEPLSYFIDILAAGGNREVLATLDPSLELGDVYTVVTYRDSREAGQMGVLLINERTDGLLFTDARFVIAHCVDDSTWQTVNLVDADTDELIAEGLALGTESGPVDRFEEVLNFGFDVLPPSPEIDEGPFSASSPAETVSVLVAVDRDTSDGSVDAEIYALGPTTRGPISTLPDPSP